MPGRLRRLSGDDVIGILQGWGFVLQSQRGSHAKLRRSDATGTSQIVVVPRHADLATGTLHGSVRKLSLVADPEAVRSAFYTE